MRDYTGYIEVVTGSMFSGKTEELIRRVRRAIIAKQKVQVFKPNIDDRYGIHEVTSHNGESVKGIPVKTATEIINLIEEETTVVAIDEAQFFDDGIVWVTDELAENGMRVIIAGLDTDFRGEPFGSMPELMCRAEEVMKLRAICEVCCNKALRTQRLIDGKPAPRHSPTVMIGAQESYQARCRSCHEVPESEETNLPF